MCAAPLALERRSDQTQAAHIARRLYSYDLYQALALSKFCAAD